MKLSSKKKLLIGFPLLACMVSSVFFFQNFTPVTLLPKTVKIIPKVSVKSINLHKTPIFANIGDMDLWRRRVWGSGGCISKEWEVCFEGIGIPGWNQRPHLDWDNAIDDDWDESVGNSKSWIVNLEKENGFMHVNRTMEGKTGGTGHFWRRDEFLTAETGFEAEFKVKIYPDSQSNGVKFHFYNDKHQFKFVFSPSEIHFHSLIGNGSRSLGMVKRNNTGVALYKIRYESGVVSLWKNDILLFSNMKPGDSDLIEESKGRLGHIAPRIGFGDNNNYRQEHQGHYAISLFRYKRANATRARKSPLLPASQDCNSQVKWTTIDNVSEIKTRTVSLDSARETLPLPHFNPFGKTIEFMAEIDFTKTDALSLDFGDHLGGIILSIKKDSIEMKANTKPGLPATVQLKIQGMNKYRLVRSQMGLYWYLYLNDKALPVLLDVRASGSSLSAPGSSGTIPRQVIHIGPFVTPSLLDFSKGETIDPRKSSVIPTKTGTLAIVENLRITDEALAANQCNIMLK